MSSSQWQPSVFQFGISFRTRQGQAPLGWLACLWLRIYEQHFGPSVGLAHPRLCTKPQFFPNKLRLMEKKRPQNFLLTGMSDFAHWNPEWRNQIFSKMAENPQHQYLFLTKRPEDIVFSTTLENAWFGVTVTSSKEKNRIRTLREHIHGGHYHVTFEPMFDDVGMVDLTGIEWIVIGTETGRRKGKTVSEPEWVRNLTDQAHTLGIPVFMKEDLLSVIGEESMVQELPPAFCRVLEVQKTWRK